MVSSTSEAISQSINREEIVPSRKRIKLPAWLEVAKPRLIPLLLATTVGGMALSEEWPLPSPRLACVLWVEVLLLLQLQELLIACGNKILINE